jgi:CO dehydrogenase nickel-insertion accessory protein CooC1
VVAVASAKGSPGCSFVAIGLAARLAEAGLPTLLVDADAEDGTLAGSLDLDGGDGSATLGGPGPLTEAAIAAASIATRVGFQLLDLSGSDYSFDGRQVAEVGRLRYPAIVADIGHRPGRLQRELVAGADWLLWVIAPDRAGFERADRLLSAELLPRVSAGIVLNRLGPDRLSDAGAVLAERHRLPLLARLPESPRAARDAVHRCGSPHRAREFRRHFAELARCVHPDVMEGGGQAWP